MQMKNFNFNHDFYEACRAIEDEAGTKAAAAMAWAFICYGYEGREIESVLPSVSKKNRLVLRSTFIGIRGRIDAMVSGALGGKTRGRKLDPNQGSSQGSSQGPKQVPSQQKEKEKEKEKDIHVSASVKHRRGANSNVMLTDEEYGKLQARFPDWSRRIDDLSFYLSSTGKTYKSHYMTLLNWARKDNPQEQAVFTAAKRLTPEEELAAAEKELAKWQ